MRLPKDIESEEQLYAWLRGLADLNGEHIWTYLLFSRAPLETWLEDPRGTLSLAKREPYRFPVFSLSRRPVGLHGRQLSGWFAMIPAGHSRIYKLVTVASREYWHRIILPFVRGGYPRLAPIYLMQRELQDGLKALSDALPPNHRINLVRASSKERITARSRTTQGSRRRYRSNVTYTQEALETAFQLAHERGQWFRSLTVDVEKVTPEGIVAVVSGFTLSKDGWTAWDSLRGRLDVSLERVLVDRTSERLNLFRNRGLVTRNYAPDVPLAIEFEVAVFDDRRVLRSFGALMFKYPRSTKALLHQNPYYHMSLSDQGDGSAFDLWVLSPRRVLVVPRLRASEPALSRLVNYIVENFRDARVSNYVANE